MAYTLNYDAVLDDIRKPCCTVHDAQPIEEKLAQCRVTSADNGTYAVMYRYVVQTLLARHNGNGDSMMQTVLSPNDIALIEKALNSHPDDEDFRIADWQDGKLLC